ncbi:MAG: prepilin-type N-terminal cleavage/methylation domain-containing protein [Kiloniellales bacterium]|nr:prepilin-type N-terminal cleavage/methylation domain-containing protein [Kiloniellales bacterium]
MKRQEQGFTLVEIAIVLVIIGLLLGGILKGQELINSARVRNLADTTSGIQAAYFGFVDRYRRIPGDWDATTAASAIGGGVNGGGNNNGRIDHTGGVTVYQEPNALWEHLSKAGFINGSYDGGTEIPTPQNNNGPFNPFNGAIVVTHTADYVGVVAPTSRLHLVLGRGIPADIARELDTKLDDAVPTTGSVRATVDDGGTPTLTGPGGLSWGGREAVCIDTTVDPDIWDVDADSQDCNIAYLF